MVSFLEKVFARYDFRDVREAWIARARMERDHTDSSAWLRAHGYEEVVVDDGALLTDDGREVIRLKGHPWALRPDVHAARLASAFDASKRVHTDETKSVVGTESLSAIVCPKCGDALQHTSVCPKCAAGKLGYRHRYTCVCGGVDLISKDKL